MTKLTALAALPLIATVVALLAFTSDTQADFLGDCPPVFTTQDVCYVGVTDLIDITVTDGHVNVIGSSATGTAGKRILYASVHVDDDAVAFAVAIYPADGCSSFVDGYDGVPGSKWGWQKSAGLFRVTEFQRWRQQLLHPG